MKALSMKQPVPELILRGKKTIETRTWKTKFRGTFLIHASQGVIPRLMEKFDFKELPKGVIVGKADLVGVKVYKNEEELRKEYELHLAEWEKFPMYGFMLKNVLRFENPIPVKGKLNFFEVDFKK
ncbi:MAG TPA: ASCH domain-containing protein [Candidatus Nanoarchaeia archaeon]|nr:ASCH domain-containing protein [Candidatus Nanoarchaeia archaeon]